jgi:hypothetical protein
MNSLAKVLGKYDTAKAMYWQALQLREKTLSEKHSPSAAH